MFNLKEHDPECLLNSVAYCGKVDRMIHMFDPDAPLNDHILKLNAGFSDDRNPNGRDAIISKGALEWLFDFRDNPAAFSLSNTSVKAMHRKLFKYSPRDDGTRGHYRTELDEDMRELFDETKSALATHDRHPLFTISLFRTSFIKMMPFITGNTLCANILSFCLLILYGYSVVYQLPLIPLLNNANSPFSQDSIDYLPFVLFNALEDLLKKPVNGNDISKTAIGAYLNPRQRNLLECVRDFAPLKISDMMKHLPAQNRNTIKKDLLYLREKKMIIAHGSGRGMYYTLSE